MRAGKLDRIIKIQRFSNTVDAYGTPVQSWTDLAELRAQIVQASTDEYIRAAGAVDETIIVFRARWFSGVTNADRVIYDGKIHNVKETKEIGRAKGLEIRTLSTGETA